MYTLTIVNRRYVVKAKYRLLSFIKVKTIAATMNGLYMLFKKLNKQNQFRAAENVLEMSNENTIDQRMMKRSY